MKNLKKLISFDDFKSVCEDKFFERRGEYNYFIRCKKGIPFCNERVCIPWNKLEDVPDQILSLKEINQKLSSKKCDD